MNLSNFQLFQRRRFYRKRLWQAQQTEIALLRSGKPVSKKIQKAIVNNGDWVQFYDAAIKSRGISGTRKKKEVISSN